MPSPRPDVARQTRLFGDGDSDSEPSIDAAFASAARIQLDETAWIDFVPGWLHGSERVFAQVLEDRAWAQHERWIADRRRTEPRLTARWILASGEPLVPSVLEQARLALSARYDVRFDSVGFNLYRDGNDSVAWHRDKIRPEIEDPVVALVSLGEPRRLSFRPVGGGTSRAFTLGHGDLLVTGGAAQRTWEHAVLKVARAGARISIAFRYGVDPRAYATRRVLA
ncbi:MAG TPA: alpha-ketoglutarate-dependent dioxygenase AlkB [Polyangiaceae bacterium]|jgi:alkylated DNA repair dioxygenase AlkB|nr:alpha-ketoglutarate-dependent dioxygenase AlkB [Polyangiaceae bacterium]